MRRRGGVGRRWGGRTVRGVTAVLLAIAGLASVAASMGNVAMKADPGRAHELAPGNGVITAAYAVSEFADRPEASAASKPARLAELAIRQDATASGALTVLAFQAQLRGDQARSNALFALSTRFSRRQLRAQIWAIESAVSRGDIVGALQQYDLALRSSTSGQALLFPTLAAALREPRIRQHLLEILAANPEWSGAFIEFAATSATEPEGAMRLFSEARRFGVPVGESQRVAVINALAASGKFDLAWQYFASQRAGASRTQSRDPDFSLRADARTVFDWQVDPAAELSAAFSNGKQGFVEFAAPPAAGGVIVRQTQLLLPGHYRLIGRSALLDQPVPSRPYWRLTCQDGREIGRVTVPNSSIAQGRFEGIFTVPQACPVQTLALVARASDGIDGVSGRIERASLTRMP